MAWLTGLAAVRICNALMLTRSKIAATDRSEFNSYLLAVLLFHKEQEFRA